MVHIESLSPITANEIRASGIWIVGCRAVVSGYIRCVICRRFRGALHTQKMAQLPDDRLQCTPHFTYCAVDYFGPFNIKDRRSVVPRYGVLFTCMMSLDIHLETANSLESDSFINALSRFIAIRGNYRKIWRRVQYMFNVFWSRWKNEYLQILQMRSKWNE